MLFFYLVYDHILTLICLSSSMWSPPMKILMKKYLSQVCFITVSLKLVDSKRRFSIQSLDHDNTQVIVLCGSSLRVLVMFNHMVVANSLQNIMY